MRIEGKEKELIKLVVKAAANMSLQFGGQGL